MSGHRVLLMYFVYLFGFIGWLPIYEDVLCLPLMTPNFRRLKRREMGTAEYWTL